MQIARIEDLPGRANSINLKKIVVHAMGEFIESGEIDYFAPDFLRKIGLSAHFFVTPSGVIIQGRDGNQVAWHAKGYNFESIGIEILVPGLHTYESFLDTIENENWCINNQFEETIQLVKWIKRQYNGTLKDNWLVRHSDLSPRRRKDPGKGFNWKEFCRRVNS
jgi:N-acetyl-anhydromuramyl-L-alanine amidase AmpD